jgi:hypothetical protein
MQCRSLPLTRLEEPQVTRRALGALTLRLDGTRAAANIITRKQALLCNASVTRSNWSAPPRRGIDPRVLEDPPRRECAGSPRLVVEAISSTGSRMADAVRGLPGAHPRPRHRARLPARHEAGLSQLAQVRSGM